MIVPAPKASANPKTTHCTPMMPMAAKLCIMVPSTFRVRVSPP